MDSGAVEVELNTCNSASLLRMHVRIMDELRKRGVVRTFNNPTGDYAESLFAKAFGWNLERNSSLGFDAKDKDEKRYQIKSRRVTRANKSRQLGVIRRVESNAFDFLAAALFDEDYSVLKGIIIPFSGMRRMRQRHSDHVNGLVCHLDDACWDIPGARNVTRDLEAAANAL